MFEEQPEIESATNPIKTSSDSFKRASYVTDQCGPLLGNSFVAPPLIEVEFKTLQKKVSFECVCPRVFVRVGKQ